MPKLIYRPKEVREMLGLSRHAYENAMQKEGMPFPIQLGPRSCGHIAEELDEWIELRKRDRLKHAQERSDRAFENQHGIKRESSSKN